MGVEKKQRAMETEQMKSDRLGNSKIGVMPLIYPSSSSDTEINIFV